MACTPNEKELVLPLRTKTLFDYARGTKLKISTYSGQVFEGYVQKNLNEGRKSTELELVNAIVLERKGRSRTVGFVRFEALEMENVEVLALPEPPAQPVKTEVIYSTVIISSEKDLLKLVKMLEGMSELALNLYGTFVGRDGKVGWITLFNGDTLICLDVLTLTQAMGAKQLWDLLALHLFENEGMEKVVYNSRPVADYLYHRHCICIQTVFDLQVAEFYIWCRGKSRQGLIEHKKDLQYKKLSECLKAYLQDEVLPEELQLLEDYEGQDFSRESPLMERPLVNKKICKCVAIDMKYLLKLKKVLHGLTMEKFKACVTSQMTEMVRGDNATLELALRLPQSIPATVLQNIISPSHPANGQGNTKNLSSQQQPSEEKTEFL